MTITYTNHVETITDSLRYLLVQEFNCEIVQEEKFVSKHLDKGEYFNYYLTEQPIELLHSDGETRNYTFECKWFFNTKQFEFRKTFDDLVSERIERLKRLLYNNRSYTPSNVYKWHHLVTEIEKSFYLIEEDEETNYAHVLCVPITIIITRSDFN